MAKRYFYSLYFLIFIIIGCNNTTPNTAPVELTDRHVHFLSPQLIEMWKNMGIPFSKSDEKYNNIDTIINTLGTKNITLVSMSYVFSSAEFSSDTSNVYALMQNENNYLSALKQKHPSTIKAYYGIDPLHELALNEVKRCHQELKLDGIKLHFNASQVYLTEPEHLNKVREVFAYAAQNNIPVLLHFDNSHPKFGARDVQILADSVLSNLPFVELQIAHFGTSGGFNAKTKDVMNAFVTLFNNNHPIAKQQITFDISAVCLTKDSEGIPKLTPAEIAELSELCRKIGFDKIVFGTDYPLYNAEEYLTVLKTNLKLTEQELQQLLKNG